MQCLWWFSTVFLTSQTCEPQSYLNRQILPVNMLQEKTLRTSAGSLILAKLQSSQGTSFLSETWSNLGHKIILGHKTLCCYTKEHRCCGLTNVVVFKPGHTDDYRSMNNFWGIHVRHTYKKKGKCTGNSLKFTVHMKPHVLICRNWSCRRGEFASQKWLKSSALINHLFSPLQRSRVPQNISPVE